MKMSEDTKFTLQLLGCAVVGLAFGMLLIVGTGAACTLVLRWLAEAVR